VIPINPIIVTGAHLALATAVSVHVLLYKRETGTASAWIGLAWFAPILGSLLYWLLGINRVRRRAQRWRATHKAPGTDASAASASRDDHLAPLERAGLNISQRRTESGNRLQLLAGGDAAYAAMIAAIDAATSSIALSSYIFRTDSAGTAFLDALARASKRGVELRVLIDGVGGGYLHSGATARLRETQVPVARFMHSALPWRMPFINLRNHRKILGVDGRIAFAGGLNIGAENLRRRQRRQAVVDTHFRIDGPVVAQLIDVFAQDWLYTTGERLSGEAWFPTLAAAGDSSARVITSGPDQDIDKIELMLLEAIGCARATIRIQTPYFLPDERLITALALASYRGVAVEIILPERSNHFAVDWATRAHIGPLLTAGCRVWTHPPPFDHSKLLTVDGLWCLVGSTNWDMRSFRLNFEVAVEIYHSELVADIDLRISRARCAPLLVDALATRPVAVRLRDSAARLLLPYL